MIHVVYWDSDVFLRLINGEEDRAFTADKAQAEIVLRGCQDVWSACQKGVMHIMTSALTIAEVIHKRSTPKLDPKYRPEINNFFKQTFISIKPLTNEIAELARDVVWDSDVMAKDAVHVATCAYFKVRELHSIDLSKKKKFEVNGLIVNAVIPSTVQKEIVNERN